MNKIFRAIGVGVIAVSLLISICSCKKTENGQNTTTPTVTTPATSTVKYDEAELSGNYDSSGAVEIDLNKNSTSSNGGATVNNGTLSITAAGTYVLKGNVNSGVIVEAAKTAKVQLVLNGANITSSNGPAIYIKQAEKVILTVAEGSKNTLTDAKNYSDTSESAPTGAIYCQDDLTINGNGTLNINAQYKDGIVCKDELKIVETTVNISSADDGIIGRDALSIKSGKFDITAGGDAIKSTNDTDDSKGAIILEGGTFNLTAGADGIQSATSLTLSGGNYTITTGGGSVNSSTKSDGSMRPGWGGWQSDLVSGDTQSAKALKATGALVINGGKFSIDSSDDSIHSNSDVTISGGEVTLKSGDDGIHGDTSLNILGGSINIAKSYEGLESANITIQNGNVTVVASDDGINVNGGNDGSAMGGRPGQNNFTETSSNNLIVSGGYVYLNASGDGLDSNGGIQISGGTVVVSGPENGGNGALDYAAQFNISGGTLVAAGSSGMAQNVSDSSTQCSALINVSGSANTVICIKDESGNEIITFAPEKQYQTLVVSTSSFKLNQTYTVYTGGSSSKPNKNGFYELGGYSGGTKVGSFTMSSTVIGSGSDIGGGPGGGFGGGPGGGGMRPR
ncbi:MAG: carbohydrate-binding domain-containing protein [Clostridia bacterium]|nr:carbohydrate-binding domain-containing protein [Clostridia bacterium]